MTRPHAEFSRFFTEALEAGLADSYEILGAWIAPDAQGWFILREHDSETVFAVNTNVHTTTGTALVTGLIGGTWSQIPPNSPDWPDPAPWADLPSEEIVYGFNQQAVNYPIRPWRWDRMSSAGQQIMTGPARHTWASTALPRFVLQWVDSNGDRDCLGAIWVNSPDILTVAKIMDIEDQDVTLANYDFHSDHPGWQAQHPSIVVLHWITANGNWSNPWSASYLGESIGLLREIYYGSLTAFCSGIDADGIYWYHMEPTERDPVMARSLLQAANRY